MYDTEDDRIGENNVNAAGNCEASDRCRGLGQLSRCAIIIQIESESEIEASIETDAVSWRKSLDLPDPGHSVRHADQR